MTIVCYPSAGPRSWLRLVLLVLLGLFAFAAPPASASPIWHSSGDLTKRSPAAFPVVDRAGIEAVIARLPKELSLIREYLRDDDVQVRLHKGDLTIDGSFANDHALIVDGDLTIRGSYDDYRDSIGILVVLGHLRAEHVVSWGSIAVSGTLEASGLVYAYYNDFTFEVAGPVKARALIVFDKSASYPRVEAAIVQTDDDDGDVGGGGDSAALAVRHFVPELMIDDVLDKAEGDTDRTMLSAVASYEAARKRVVAGLPIFRDRPGPESLGRDVLRLFAPNVDAAMMARLAKADRLLAMVVASREAVPIDVQQQLAASGDAAIIERLAANPNTGAAVLARIAHTNAATAASVARHRNASPEVMASLAASTDPAVRKALVEGGRHLRRLPQVDLARLIADPEVTVRAALPRHDAVLSVEQLAVLARDRSPVVRQAVARSVSEQALWRQVPIGTAEARAAVMATLLADSEIAVRVAALPGASAAAHEQFVARLLPEDRARADAELASLTRSVTLMTRAANGEQAGAVELAKNLAITPALQRRLIARLPEAAKRPRISIVDLEILSKQAESWDAVIDTLVQNPNATADTLLAISRYCRAASGRAGFCNTLLERRDLAADVFDALHGAVESEEWALSALTSHYTTRAQLERAVPRWYDDEPEILAAFKNLRSQPDRVWWTALATSPHTKLREIAAAHAATPPTMLVRLLRDPDGDVAGLAASNPSTPSEALAAVSATTGTGTVAAGSSWILANPRIPDTLVHRLLDRALVDDDPIVASGCKALLAARALRAAP